MSAALAVSELEALAEEYAALRDEASRLRATLEHLRDLGGLMATAATTPAAAAGYSHLAHLAAEALEGE